MSLAGCQINSIDVNFHLQKSLEFFDTNLADKIQSQNYKEVKVPCLMPIRVMMPFYAARNSNGLSLSSERNVLYCNCNNVAKAWQLFLLKEIIINAITQNAFDKDIA